MTAPEASREDEGAARLRLVQREEGSGPGTSGHAPLAPEDDGLFRLLVESVQDYAIFALDPAGRILTWSAGAARLKGYEAAEIVGKHFSIFYPPEDLAAGKPARELAEATRDGRTEDQGWRLRKDGTRFWANVVVTALRDGEGSLVGFAKVTRDLTGRMQAEQALRQSEERLRLLIQNARDYAIFMLDPDGRVASWNEGARRIKGYEAEEIIGRHFSSFYPAADVAAGKPESVLETAAAVGRYEEEGWRVRKDGTCFWASVTVTAMYADDGGLVGYAKVTRDLTERRAAQERAIADARRLAEVESANRAKSQFLTALSHELRTPINATLGYVDLMEAGVGGPLSPQHTDYLVRVRGNQRYLLRLITDLLDYSRIEAGHIEYDRAPVDLHEVVDTVLPMVAPQSRTKGMKVAHGPCPEGVVALADRGRTEQIVLNLLSNAVKFTPEGGRVLVGCGRMDDRVVITVADSGPGIPPTARDSVFQPFVQLGRSLTSSHEGTGLGLAISRDLARAMGGDLTLQDGPRGGSVFTLSLPPG